MCGIAGVVSSKRIDPSRVEKMTAEMVHRGPDEGGIWVADGCTLGHRRLRIIDLSASGAQPMTDEAQRIAVVFNGEIFNYRELREQLQERGHAFVGRSDTEVILRGYQEWGEKVVSKLLGMFAIGLWDAKAKKLLLARDRYGKKPLFYSHKEEELSFASELEALLAAEGGIPKISGEGFASYLRYGYVPGSDTVLPQVLQLRAGHLLQWQAGKFQQTTFGDAPVYRSRVMKDGEFLHQLDTRLQAAVEARLISDVPLGCFLSGGIDSSLVVAYARKIYGPKLKTFTVSFPGTMRDEGDYGKKVAEILGTDHHTIQIEAQDMEKHYIETLQRCPEPLGDDSFLPTYFISCATRRYVTVALSGDGGDELFGGYPKYRQIRVAAALHPFAQFMPAGLLSLLPDRWAKAGELAQAPAEWSRALWLSSLWKESELKVVLEKPLTARKGQTFFKIEWEKHRRASLEERFAMTDIATYLEGSILRKVDRASMAASLEVRAPLLDERILDLTVTAGVRDTALGKQKRALRTLLSRHLPLEIFRGAKRGFGLPIDEWFRGGLRVALMKYTDVERLRKGGLVDPQAVARIRDDHLSGRRNYGRKLHALVAWEVWREKAGL
jgi:asparagine synthase (glutamine-hydrolysing)